MRHGLPSGAPPPIFESAADHCSVGALEQPLPLLMSVACCCIRFAGQSRLD